MKIRPVACCLVLGLLGAAGASAQTPVAPEATERSISPYDRNPACRDRNVSATDPACVIHDGPPLVRPYGVNVDNRPQQPVAPAQPPAGNSAPPVVIMVPQAGNPAR